MKILVIVFALSALPTSASASDLRQYEQSRADSIGSRYSGETGNRVLSAFGSCYRMPDWKTGIEACSADLVIGYEADGHPIIKRKLQIFFNSAPTSRLYTDGEDWTNEVR